MKEGLLTVSASVICIEELHHTRTIEVYPVDIAGAGGNPHHDDVGACKFYFPIMGT